MNISEEEFQFGTYQDVVETESGEAEAELVVNFVGNSEAIFIWTDNYDNKILNPPMEDEDEEDTGDFINNVYYKETNEGAIVTNLIKNEKYSTFVNNTMAKLTILNPELKDFGQYTLHVKYLLGNIGHSSEIKFQLRVISKFNLNQIKYCHLTGNILN